MVWMTTAAVEHIFERAVKFIADAPALIGRHGCHQERFVILPELLCRFTFARLGDDPQFDVHAASASCRLGFDYRRRRLVGGNSTADAAAAGRQGTLDPQGSVFEITHCHDTDVVLVQRGVDRAAETDKEPNGVPADYHQEDDERGRLRGRCGCVACGRGTH